MKAFWEISTLVVLATPASMFVALELIAATAKFLIQNLYSGLPVPLVRSLRWWLWIGQPNFLACPMTSSIPQGSEEDVFR